MNRLAPILFITLAFLAGCSEDAPTPEPLQGLAPDFALLDVNPNSASYDSTISPRGYLEKVSAWYFGHST